ncbi:probable LRR receptor-like serine/threonine-protein kinase At3g47570 [Manihot esculenta]|uniref:Uncharacterized protein n=1 Tax=Manihot esculenta TaxID=3983 RepID=A0ACB7HWC1_MANES|nr:probable LRR receptor-like serine/threonine-protein kinase At3g47570 [Manihot esculenta]KAG8656249.1 hypothetical protein MANES_04G110563v8 [Manihot esculenta]
MRSCGISLHSPSLIIYLQVILLLSSNIEWWKQANASGNETDKLALLKFKEAISASDPNQLLDSWNDSLPFCNWFGITCSRRHQRVKSLDLEGQNLFGTISPYIGNLSFLRDINLQNNSFHGEIPQEVGRLFRLEELFLNNNTLAGEIPINLTRCSKLMFLDLGWNYHVSGKIPAELGSLTKLQNLSLVANNLIGEIPASLGNLSSLTFFRVSYNRLLGNIPDDLGKLTSLTVFAVSANQLSGTIPLPLFNISSIRMFYVIQNQLHGNLPENLGITLPNLIFFSVGNNNFSGTIPNSLFNASHLEIVNLGWSNFVGQVPMNLGNLKNLWWLRLHGNALGSNSTNDLAFLDSLTNCTKMKILDLGRNNFGGVLPNSVANLSTELGLFYIGENQITGTIPAGLENLIKLTGMALDGNLLSGVFPNYFGKFQKLQFLSLGGNRLSGEIPSSIGNLTHLLKLCLPDNNFQGSIPSSIGNCQNLYFLEISQNHLNGVIPPEISLVRSFTQLLDLSQNSLTGVLPFEVGKLSNIGALDFSENNLSGQIPATIGDCLSLEFLYLQGNSFQGTIPPSLASLRGLQYLDLSRNKLTGRIPKDLQDIPYLLFLNLSFNDLEGEVPTGGVFRNASAVSLIGNDKLCGGVSELNLPKCPNKRGGLFFHKLEIILTVMAVCILLTLAFLLVYWKRNPKQKSSSSSSMMKQFLKVSYGDICRATNGFSPENLIGSGSFGSVYKGFLDQVERPVAVKVLKLEHKGASKSFISECIVLRNIRHRNLVKMLTCCSSMDYKLNDFKALILEFMGNGSLEKWLHPEIEGKNQPWNLNLLQRLNVAVDVASALQYLHEQCENPIIHCDLKPSNILFDDDMVAHVSDFGLARLVSTSKSSSQSLSSTTGIKGTIGYAPPEYGMGCPASREGDVYSFGILVLEMFTGRRPTDEIFKDGLNLHSFVKTALPESLMQIIDPNIITATEEERELSNSNGNLSEMSAKARSCVVSVLEIGIGCSAESPKGRMSMEDVSRQLDLIRKTFLGI